ncbi:MAG TPA: protein kinase [Pyrinomonadaceae bacterium]|nr:protein kinase [Pyrinomonadaceae bacterium]
MTPERWRQIERLLQEALEHDPGEQADFLERACAGEPSLREEVELLLASQPDANFLAANALEDATILLGEDEPDPLLGRNFAHYYVEAKLGAGGMGEVYLARDLTLGRKVALKLLDSVLADDSSSRARFLREARLAASLDHPNICTIHEVGEAEGRPFIAMQYIEGDTLKKLIGSQPLAMDSLLSVMIQVATALAAAHARGIVHRDIKSNNIIVTPQEQAKVLDFGIAKLLEKDGNATGTEVTVTGQLIGTPSSMSPEQARGRRVDERADVWSLGVVLYEMITGHAPFTGETANDVLALVLQGDPPPLSHYVPEAPEPLQTIVSKALRKDPNERYQTVEEMIADLREVKRRLVVQDTFARSTDDGKFPQSTIARTGPGGVTNVGGVTTTGTTSSAEYLVTAIKKHGRAIGIVAFLIGLFTIAAVMIYRSPGQANTPFQSTKITRLTTVGTATAASVSPDGKYVAYATGEAVRTGFFTRWPAGRSSLWVKQISTDSAVELVPATDVEYKGTTFSPDGEFVYYVITDETNPAGVLYRVPVLGGTPRKILTRIHCPVTFSPDGKHLAFARNYENEGVDALIVANADGTGERRVTDRKGGDWIESDGLAWSPDGKTIVFGAGTDVGGTHETLVAVPVTGGEPKTIAPQKWRSLGRIAWLGDGSGLVVMAGHSSNTSWSGTDAQIWHVSYPEGSARKITNDLNGYTHSSLGVTADSRSIVTTQEDTSARIWTVPLDTSFSAGVVKQITTGKFEGRHGLSWSPDGRIVYITKVGDDEDVWIMNEDGTGRRQLTDDAAIEDRTVVSPDGRYMYFGSTRSGTQQIWRMDADGSNSVQLTKGEVINVEPSVSPDGKWIVFSAWKSGPPMLWKMPADGGEPTRLTDNAAARPMFSSDGKFISCVYFDAEGSGQWRLAIIPSEGGRPTRILDLSVQTVNTLAGVWWTPDRRALVYVDTQRGVSNVWKIPVDGGKPTQLTNFDSGQIFNLALSHDGRRLAVARGGISADVVLISDLK